MSTIRYPVPYRIYALIGRSKRPYIYDVALELTFDVKDVPEQDAPVAVSMMKAWPLGLYRSEFENGSRDREDAPTTEVRFYNGALYAPMVKHNKQMAEPQPVHADEFRALFDGFSAATPLQHLYTDYDFELLKRYFAGELPRLEDIAVREIIDGFPDAITPMTRVAIIDRATKDANGIIAIGGLLWRRLTTEPLLRYRADSGRRSVAIEIVLGEDRQHDRNGGYFRLDRLEDCRDHVAAQFPDYAINELFRDLSVIDNSILTYEDDIRALTVSAWDLLHLSSFDLEEFSPEAGRAFYDLREFNRKIGRDEEIDFGQLAITMGTIVQSYPTNRLTPAIKASLERWAMRPMEFSGPAI